LYAAPNPPKGGHYLLVVLRSTPMFPGMNGIDPSKLSPEVISEITSLMQTLSPDQIMKMQTLMHNAMAGMNVTSEMAEFERGLPPTFRERMARIQYMANGVALPPKPGDALVDSTPLADPQNENEARLVILNSVAQGLLKPEDALKVLFP
jgi:hypothetical protein